MQGRGVAEKAAQVDKDGNEAVIDSVTQVEKLKTLKPEELVNTLKFMVETVKALGKMLLLE